LEPATAIKMCCRSDLKNRATLTYNARIFANTPLSELIYIRAALTSRDLSSDTKFSQSQSRVTLPLNICTLSNKNNRLVRMFSNNNLYKKFKLTFQTCLTVKNLSRCFFMIHFNKPFQTILTVHYILVVERENNCEPLHSEPI